MTAARMIARAGRPPLARTPEDDALADHLDSAAAHTRRAAWTVARARGGWEELLADLRLVRDPDPVLAREAAGAVRGWVRRPVLSRPAPELRAAVDAGVARAYRDGLLSREVADLIGFTGGLTRYPRVRAPSPEPPTANGRETAQAGRLTRLSRWWPRRRG